MFSVITHCYKYLIVILLCILSVFNVSGQTWSQTSAPVAYWSSITTDSSGQFVAAISTNYTDNTEIMYISSSG